MLRQSGEGSYVLAHLSDSAPGAAADPAPLELLSKRGLGYLNWLRKRRRIHRAEMLAALVADLKARQPDHIAVTGDLVNLSLANEFAPARAWIGARRPGPVTLVPGNHDCYVRPAATFAAHHWGEYMRGDYRRKLSVRAPARAAGADRPFDLAADAAACRDRRLAWRSARAAGRASWRTLGASRRFAPC